MTKELWKVIPDAQNYEVSNMGYVRNRKTKHVLKPSKNNSGYWCFMSSTVHRLVAKAFVPMIPGKDVINHIDANRDNNAASNLEWMTNKENNDEKLARVGADTEAARAKLAKVVKKPIYQLDDSGKILHKYNSVQEASLAVCGHKRASKISTVLHGGRKRAYGYGWKYVNPEQESRGSYKTSEKHLANLAKKRAKLPPVYQYDMEGNFIKQYANRFAVLEEHPKYVYHSFQSCLAGKRKSYLGYVWKEQTSNLTPEKI